MHQVGNQPRLYTTMHGLPTIKSDAPMCVNSFYPHVLSCLYCNVNGDALVCPQFSAKFRQYPVLFPHSHWAWLLSLSLKNCTSVWSLWMNTPTRITSVCCEVVLTVDRSTGRREAPCTHRPGLQWSTCHCGIASYLNVLSVIESRGIAKQSAFRL